MSSSSLPDYPNVSSHPGIPSSHPGIPSSHPGIPSGRPGIPSSQAGRSAEYPRVQDRSLTDATDAAATRPIRVALILYRDDLNVGGSLRVAEVLANSLDPKRVEAHVVFAYGEPG